MPDVIPFDAESIGQDPVLSRTSWKRATTGGNGAFKLHVPVRTSADVLVLRPRIAAWQFAFLSCCFYSLIYLYFSSRENPESLAFILAGCIMGAVAFGVSGWIELQPIYFHKQRDLLWKGRRPGKGKQKYTGRYTHRLSDIYALQIIRTWAQGGRGGWLTYELNAVFKNGERQNISECYGFDAIQSSGKIIADFLGLKIYCKKD